MENSLWRTHYGGTQYGELTMEELSMVNSVWRTHYGELTTANSLWRTHYGELTMEELSM
ncbi:uncharacterized, partial [Tachysurus ichikawai]